MNEQIKNSIGDGGAEDIKKVNEIRALMEGKKQIDPNRQYQEKYNFAVKLKEKYPDTYLKCRLYLLLVGGSQPEVMGEDTDGFFLDFPGEDSIIEKFITSLGNETSK